MRNIGIVLELYLVEVITAETEQGRHVAGLKQWDVVHRSHYVFGHSSCNRNELYLYRVTSAPLVMCMHNCWKSVASVR